MAARLNQMATNRVSLIPTKSQVAVGTKAGDEENGVPGPKQGSLRGPAIGAVKGVPSRRVGLSLLSNNVRRPNVIAVSKKTAPIASVGAEDEAKKMVATGHMAKQTDHVLVSKSSGLFSLTKPATQVKAPSSLIKEPTEDVLAPDSYVPIDVLKFMTEAEITAVRSMEDPDANDADEEFLNTEYVKDVLVYLYEREVKMQLETNFMKDSKHVLPRHRRMLVDWLMTVHNRFRCSPETIYLAVYVLDSFMSKKHDIPTNRYQLVGITAMVIAAKFEEVWPPSIDDLVSITDKAFTHGDVLKMEREILRTIDFVVARPLPITFLRRFSKLADVNTDVHAMAKFLIELSLLEYNLSGVRPSKLAAAALFLSLKLNEIGKRPSPTTSTDEAHSFWDAKLTYFTHYPAQVLLPVVYELCALATKVSTATEDNYVMEKYSSSKVFRVSKSPLLRSRLVRTWGAKSVLMSTDQVARSHPTSTASSGKAVATATVRPKLVPIKRAGTNISTVKPLANRPAFRP